MKPVLKALAMKSLIQKCDELLSKSAFDFNLPCYTEDTTDAQRGRGVFQRSIQALKDLNAVGYGIAGSGLDLDLMYNPSSAVLPPGQEKLEEAYRSELGRAVPVVPMKPLLKPPGTKRLKLDCDIPLPTVTFKFNLRRCSRAGRMASSSPTCTR